MRFKTILGLLSTSLLLFSAGVSQEDIRVLNFSQLEPHLHLKTDTVYLVNFWATWCKPCVEELPAFQKISDEYKNENVKILLVSLDFPSQVDSRLKPFLSENDISMKTVLLDDPNQNVWINKVHPSWSGSIPATLIYSGNSRDFYEKSFTYTELKKIVEQKIQ
jgi:thiol-disulfide isomerase/thioredoxin